MTRLAPEAPTIGLLKRNSTVRQVGNFRSEVQEDMAPRVVGRGCQVRWYDEQGTSGSDLTKRTVTMTMLDDLKKGVIQGIGAYDVKRLTRDQFGIDGGTMARRIVEAGGRFHTWDREYNLRLDDDLLQFQFQCFIAGLDWRNIRNTLWSGIFKKLEREPVFMKAPLGYMTESTDLGSGRTRKRVVKNPAHAPILEKLATLLDDPTITSLAEVVRILNRDGPERPTFRGRGGTSTRWHVYGLRYILQNPIYTGTFSFGANLKKRSTVWDQFAIDPRTGEPKDFLQHVPELAYWEPWHVRRWQRKFAKPANARVMTGSGKTHVLLGVLECVTCGSRMIAHGSATYACPAVGSGRGRKGLTCSAPQLIVENVAMQILRREFPRALEDAQDIAERARAQLQQREPSAASQRLAFLQERAAWLSDQLFQTERPMPSLLDKLQHAEAEIAVLQDQVTAEEDARLEDESLAKTCDFLLRNPVAAFDALPPEMQARVYTLMFSSVRIETRGFASGRQWRLKCYTARIGDELRMTDDAPWGRRRNPKSKLVEGESRDTVIFDTLAESGRVRTLGNDISPRVSVAYQGLFTLRELASALAAG